ncbi:MAG: serine hydrolase domain-containing protein [Nitrospirales bacterium]
MDQPDPITRVLREGVRTGVFPGAVLLVRHQGHIHSHQAIGHISSFPNAPHVQLDTIYDLASLTKVLVTGSSILLLVQEGRLSLSQTLDSFLAESRDSLLGQISLRDVLSHQSGLPGYRPFYQSFSPVFPSEPASRQQRIQGVLEMILKEPIDRASASTSVYSDLGYMVLGFVVERVAGQSLTDFSRERIFLPLEADNLAFGLHDVHGNVSGQIALTEEDPWRGRVLQGEVHDENAAALGGIAGHAGLFGTAHAVGQITKAWLDSFLGKPSIFQQELVSQFVHVQPGTSWALGWDTPSHPSSSGQWFSPQSFGHLGFTGTSIWIDPIRELEVIFLSNRVHPTRANQAIKAFRPQLHDVIIQGL